MIFQKKYAVLLFCLMLGFTQRMSGQTVGIYGSVDYCDTPVSQYLYGFSGSVDIPISTHTSIMLFGEHSENKVVGWLGNYKTCFTSNKVNAALLWSTLRSSKMNFKFGLGAAYNFFAGGHYLNENYLADFFDLRYLGPTVALGINYRPISTGRLCIELLVLPKYMFDISQRIPGSSSTKTNQFSCSANLGLCYNLKKL